MFGIPKNPYHDLKHVINWSHSKDNVQEPGASAAEKGLKMFDFQNIFQTLTLKLSKLVYFLQVVRQKKMNILG